MTHFSIKDLANYDPEIERTIVGVGKNKHQLLKTLAGWKTDRMMKFHR